MAVHRDAVLNFSMNEDAFDKEKIRHHVQLCDTATHKIFYDKLEYIYVEISKFNKPLEELDMRLLTFGILPLFDRNRMKKPLPQKLIFPFLFRYILCRSLIKKLSPHKSPSFPNSVYKTYFMRFINYVRVNVKVL